MKRGSRMDFEKGLKSIFEKVEGVSNKSWQELVDELDLGINKDTLRKAIAVGQYSGYNIAQFYEKKMLENKSSDEIKEIEVAKQELFKERVKIQDQKREFNKLLREEARFERLLEVLKSIVEPFEMDCCRITPKSNKQATAIISDTHIGIEIDNQVNYFNIEIAKERLEEFTEKVLMYCEIHNVGKLNVVLLGDLISGVINCTARIEQEEDVISSILTTSELLSTVINKFSETLNVTVYGVYGNHSRVHSDKKQSLNRENFERLIFEYIKLKVKNVKVYDSKYADYMTFKVDGKTIVATHGNNDKVSNCVSHFVNLLGEKVDYILMGHIHHFNVKNDNNTKIIVNGSLVSTDDYALSLRANTKASQTLIIHDIDDIIIEVGLK